MNSPPEFLQYPLTFCFSKANMKPGVKMSAWPGKFVIGLTEIIAAGKSVVRKTPEHLVPAVLMETRWVIARSPKNLLGTSRCWAPEGVDVGFLKISPE